MERSIIHLNIADFAVAVETCRAPALKDYPVVVAPLGTPRAVVYDISETAFREGIRKGMPLDRVRRQNRQVRILPPRFNRYERAMADLIRQARTFTPCIESGRNDGHIFLDVTRSSRLFGPARDVARRLKNTFQDQFGLDPIWSVATNKLVAKVATRVVKPAGEYIVPPGEEAAFLSPLSVGLIPGLAPEEIQCLNEFNLFTVSRARALSRQQLAVVFDSRAADIFDRLRGVDPAPVHPSGQDRRTVRAGHEFSSDTNRADQLRRGLYQVVACICRTLHQRERCAARARITLSYTDGLQSSAGMPLSPAASGESMLFRQCVPLLEKAWKRRIRVRHLSLSCDRLVPAAAQQTLFSPNPRREKQQAKLAAAMDRIRERFGKNSVVPALALASGESGP